jgi:hypothetical protein
MCVVSMIGDHYNDKWNPPYQPSVTYTWTTVGPTQEEFDNLKKEVIEMKELLKKAKIYDEKSNEPDCEMEEKMNFLREVAKLVDVDLDEVFKPKQ